MIQKYLNTILYNSYLALFFITPLLLSIKSSELFEFPKMVFVYVLTTVIVTTWIITVISRKKWYWRKTILDIPLVLIIITQLISTIWSLHPYTSWLGYYSRSHGGLLSTICYALLVWGFIQHYQKGWAQAIIYASFASASISSLYAIAEHFGIDAEFWVQDVQNRVYSTLGQPNWLAAWLATLLPFTIHSFLSTPRNNQQLTNSEHIIQTTANVLITTNLLNILVSYGFTYLLTQKTLPVSGGSLMLFVMFYVITTGFNFNLIINHLVNVRDKLTTQLNIYIAWTARYAPIVLFGLFTTAILYTKSRSGILALFVAMAIYALGYGITSRPLNSTSIRKICIPYLIFILLTLLIGTEFTPSINDVATARWLTKVNQVTSPQNTAIQYQNYPQYSDLVVTDSTDIRKAVWQGSLIIWEKHPFFGTGTETFAYSYYNDRPKEHNDNSEWDFLYNKAHNEYLNFLANNGLLGLAAISLYIILTIWLAVKAHWQKWAGVLGIVIAIQLLIYLLSPQLSQTLIKKLIILPQLLIPLGISAAIAVTVLIITAILDKDQPKTTSQLTKAAKAIGAKVTNLPQSSLAASLSLPVLASLITIFITNFYGFSVVNVAVIFFFLPALLIVTTSNWQDSEPKPAQLSLIQIVLIATIAVISILFIFKFYQYFQSDKFYNFSKSYLNQGAILEANKEIDKAIALRPNEADFYLQKAAVLSQTALTLHLRDASTSADSVKQLADQSSLYIQESLRLNPVHLNIYKNATRDFLTLAYIDPQYYSYALAILNRAQELAPTDPQITINIALIFQQQQQHDKAEDYFKKTVELKPNYRRAWMYLGEFYHNIGQIDQAKATYQWILDNIDPKDQTSIDYLNSQKPT